jgi:Ca-activated chloride channel family protein
VHFAVDIIASILALLSILALGIFTGRNFSKKTPPSFSFSRVNDLKSHSWRTAFVPYSTYLQLAALILLLLAFIDPHLQFKRPPNPEEKQQPSQQLPTEGIAIYLDLDQSGSMSEKVTAINKEGFKQTIPKIDLLKQVTGQFIKDHPTDLIGLVAFARVPKVLIPLTLDQEALLNQLGQFQVVKKTDEDGTGIGYAIYKTAQLIAATRHFSQDLRSEGEPSYTIKSAVIIVVTDGFQDPNRLDQGNQLRTMELDDAAAFAKSQNIRLYVINIDPTFSSPQYAPHRRQLKAITEKTGGKFFLTGDSQSLQDIYQSINELEKNQIPQEALLTFTQSEVFTRFSLYPFLICLGLAALFSALILDSYVLRRVP